MTAIAWWFLAIAVLNAALLAVVLVATSEIREENGQLRRLVHPATRRAS